MNEENTPTPLQFRNGIIEEAPLNTVQLRGRRTIGSVNTLFLTAEEHNYYGSVFAAAPELLEALIDLVWLIEQRATNDEIIESIYYKANPAINKVSIIKKPE